MSELERLTEISEQASFNSLTLFEILDAIEDLDKRYKDASDFREEFNKYFKENNLAGISSIRKFAVINYFSYKLERKNHDNEKYF